MTSITHELPNEEAYFRQLKNTPLVAWPTLIVFFISLGVIGGASYLAYTGVISYWVATIINGIGIYFLFSPAHDALHRSISSVPLINEVIGRIALLLFLPAAPLEVARWIHFQHHRFTSCENDPDNFIHHGKWWQLMFRWVNFDMYYMAFFLRQDGPQKQRHAKNLTIAVVGFLALIVGLIAFGYGKEFLFFWFLPSRISCFLVAFVFVFLPHYPAEISSEENVYKATTIRRGWEWLLTPLMVYQNYHLIHHLYPTAPFYNYMKIWHLKYNDFVANEPAIQSSFGLLPINHNKPSK